MKKGLSLLFSMGIFSCGNSLLSSSVQAQVAPDGTTNTTVNSEGNNFTIENGDRAGSNLFHSFQDFSVPNDGSAVFNNSPEIENIFSRVTGGNISNINGLIQANDANLFLVNPAGILFGENARLDIGGSFLGTTADSILFEDGEFSATDFDNPPLLTVNAPIGLSFRDNPQAINIDRQPQGSADFNQAPSFDDNLFGLRVADGKTFALAGGDITADGGGIVAVGGRIDLGAVEEAGILGLNFEGDTISFDFPDDLARANISLTNGAGFLVSGSGGGDLVITANNIEILEGSGLFAGIFGGLGSPDAQAGDVLIDADGSILVDNFSAIRNDVNTNSIGNAGDITINTTDLTVKNSVISSSTNSLGNSGNITVNASNLIDLNGERPNNRNGVGSPGGILAQADLDAEGNAGNLTIETKVLSISDGAKAQVATFGQGNAGNLSVKAENIEIFNTPVFSDFTTGIFADVARDPQTVNLPEGSAGNINIETQTLVLKDGGMVTASTTGLGDAGSVIVKATNFLEISGIDPDGDSASVLGSEVEQGAIGSAGDVTIETNRLSVIDAGQISVSTFGGGDAGNLSIFANTVEIDGGESNLFGGLFAQVLPGAIGEGGNIIIGSEQSSVETLNIINGALISLNTFGQGNAGNLTINLAESMSLSNGSTINANTFGQGNAGNITINGETADISFNEILQIDDLTFSNSGIFSTVANFVDENGQEFVGTRQGGNVTISSQSLSISDFAVITTSTFGVGNAGNIDLTAAKGINLENSGTIRSIVEQGGLGNAGNINIQSQSLTISSGGQIGTGVFRAGFNILGGSGNGGNITIKATDFIDISGTALEQLQILDPTGDPQNTTGLVPTAGFSSGLIANTQTGANGNAGNINVTTNSLRISDGAIVNSTTSNEGLGGNIILNATELDLTSGGQILTTSIDSSGNAGTIKLNLSDTINISGFDPDFEARLARANEFGSVQGGERIVENQGAASGVFANTSPNSTGDGGNIEIGIFKPEGDSIVLDNTSFTNNVLLSNRGTISADSQGEGNGGDVKIRSGSLNLEDRGEIVAETASGQGGNIFINIDENLILRDGSSISAEAFNNGTGGNLTIDTNFIIAFPDGNNDIVANAQQGQGGVITINAESLLGIEERQLNDSTNDINASSEASDLDGDIVINTSDINPIQGATELPNNLVTPEQTVTQACTNRGASQANSLVVKGKGGVPASPTDSLSSETITINGEPVDNSDYSAYVIPTAQGNIIPARGVIKTAEGQVILTAVPVNNRERVPHSSVNCG